MSSWGSLRAEFIGKGIDETLIRCGGWGTRAVSVPTGSEQNVEDVKVYIDTAKSERFPVKEGPRVLADDEVRATILDTRCRDVHDMPDTFFVMAWFVGICESAFLRWAELEWEIDGHVSYHYVYDEGTLRRLREQGVLDELGEEHGGPAA